MRVITNATAVNAAVARQGRKYGYSFQKFAPKRAGKRSAGRESEPPRSGLSSKQKKKSGSAGQQEGDQERKNSNTHPRLAPVAHTTGISAKAFARFVGSVSSPIALFITPDLKEQIMR